MKKADLNSKLREYAKNSLSPTNAEQALVSRLYMAVQSALGGSCLLIGSYARFTSSRPLHDLDILFVAGNFEPNQLNPRRVLDGLHAVLRDKFRNPTPHRLQISQQTHSVTMSFRDRDNEYFAIDVVPAFVSGIKNEFNQDIFWVPEIVNVSLRKREQRYKELTKVKKQEIEWWIKSDPRGYIETASRLNNLNPDFRKVVKLVKKWKHNSCEKNDAFALKSFHVEQAIFEIFRQKPTSDISEVLFSFFCTIPSMISHPQIRDRADITKFIDHYVSDLGADQKKTISQARDSFLIRLENLEQNSNVSALLEAGFYQRASDSESFLFDSSIPTYTERDALLRVVGKVRVRRGFRPHTLSSDGIIDVERKIDFVSNFKGPYHIDLFKGKVRNDNSSPQPRGEITDHRTRNNPESTKYKGTHFVECYAIRDGVCIARNTQLVVLRSV
jgi:hypothetical protein